MHGMAAVSTEAILTPAGISRPPAIGRILEAPSATTLWWIPPWLSMASRRSGSGIGQDHMDRGGLGSRKGSGKIWSVISTSATLNSCPVTAPVSVGRGKRQQFHSVPLASHVR